MYRKLTWLGFAGIIVIFFGTTGVALMTAQRQQVNAPLVVRSEQLARQLNDGVSPRAAASGSVALNSSLEAFSIIYAQNGQPIAGSGKLNGRLPSITIGVLTASSGKEYSLVTWQPQGTLRFAVAVVAAQHDYVLTGQSLRFADRDRTATEQISVLGCTAALIVLAATYYLAHKK